MKIGVNLFSIRKHIQTKNDLLKTLKFLKSKGCDYAQFSASPVTLSDVAEVSKIGKLPIVLTHSPLDRILHDLDKLMAEHKALGCHYIGLGMLDKKIYNQEKELLKNINALEAAAKKMNKNGFTFFFHHHQFEFKHLSNGETVLDYMVKHAPHIHFTLDTYWAQYGGANILDLINKLKGRIECVHLKDYKINNELNPEFAVLGEGNIDFKKIVKEAKKAGTKYFLIEQDNASDHKNGLQEIVKSIKYAKENL